MTDDLFGLGDDAERVYRAVIDAAHEAPEVTTAETLAAETGLPEERVAEALEVLVASGLVLRVPSSSGLPVRFEPASASTTWAVWLQGVADRLRPVQDLARALAALPQSSAGNVAGVIELVEGRGQIARRADELQRGTRKLLRIIDKPPYAVDSGGGSLERERELLARGVKVRAVYDTAGLASLHDLREDVQPAWAAGEQARVRTDAPLKVALFDDTAALVPVASDQPELSQALVIHRGALLDGLDALFEYVWKSALPFDLPVADEATRAGHDGPTLEELQLLTLLTAGLSDEAITRHLHVALRTTQRRVRAVMDRLGAATRFQAGLLAARSGWIGTDTDAIHRSGPGSPDTTGEPDQADETRPVDDIESLREENRELTARLADSEAARTAAERILVEARAQLDRARDRATTAETRLQRYQTGTPGENDQP